MSKVIIDSAMTLSEALGWKDIPSDIRETLAIISVQYISFDARIHQGQLVLHKDICKEVEIIFQELHAMSFPIQQVVPIVAYNWDDNASMIANNSSAFNYRSIAGSAELSNHSFGLAIDINPTLNPYMQRDGIIVPEGSVYNPTRPGTVTKEIAHLFTARGFEWGGDWEDTRKDWQHFTKSIGLNKLIES